MQDNYTTSDLATSYASRTAALRDTARWLLTAAAGVGALLVAGLQLTTLGSLDGSDWPRLLAALLGLAGALFAVGYMVWAAGVLLSEEWTTLAQLHLEDFQDKLDGSPHRAADKWRRDNLILVRKRLVLVADETYGSVAKDIDDLSERLAAASLATREGGKSETLQQLLSAANAVVQFANFERTRARFGWLRKRLAGASLVAAVGVIVYAYAANPPVATLSQDLNDNPASPVASATWSAGGAPNFSIRPR